MRNSWPGRWTIDVSGMGRPPAFLPIAVGVMVIAGCDGASQCVHPSIYAADEARGCLQSDGRVGRCAPSPASAAERHCR